MVSPRAAVFMLAALWAWDGYQHRATQTSPFRDFPGNATATYSGQTYSAYGETGYAVPFGSGTLTPHAGLLYTHLHDEGYV